MISIDTNVLVYLWDNSAPQKMTVAQRIVSTLSGNGAQLGLQVIGETQAVRRRTVGQPPWLAAQNARNLLVAFDTFAADEANVAEALALMAAGRMNYWDALLVTASRDAGCTVLLTEDMQDGFQLGDLEIVHPFGPTGPSARLETCLQGR